ncbi:MAG TPA: helix-turn-helix domain-containing protein [Mycobacteriales bacterium]|nr:helix-turn-helix domain-containing protein [Mycobacteriales bacterium]
MAPLPALMSTGDAQREFGFSPQTLRNWARQRLVRHVRTPGGQVRFYREDLEALFQPIEPEPADRKAS